MTPSVLDRSLRDIKGAGEKCTEKFARLGIETLGDLLFRFPLRYENHTERTAIGALDVGKSAVICAEILKLSLSTGRKKSLLIQVRDQSGQITLRFYHFSALQKRMRVGARILCFGTPRLGKAGLEIVHPNCRFLAVNEPVKLACYLTAIYSTTEGLSQYQIRKYVRLALHCLTSASPQEVFPSDIMRRYHLMALLDAIVCIHRPLPKDYQLLQKIQHPAQKRLIVEELLAYYLRLRLLRRKHQSLQGMPMVAVDATRKSKLLAQFGFDLTAAQERVIREIEGDLGTDKPMLRLVQGDVGSGKTVICACAALQVVENNGQIAMMAPTELLAQQHFVKFSRWFVALGVPVVLLTGKTKGKKRAAILHAIKNNQAAIIIGTHAVFVEDVQFAKLALVIIDEQHRFGVHQRLALQSKGQHSECIAHQLILTATPIPRTLAMSIYGDLEHSIIDAMPPGRRPVKTVLLANNRREAVLNRLKKYCAAGKQAYWICPLIEASQFVICQAAEETFLHLKQQFPELSVALLHGRMTDEEKKETLKQFQQGSVHLLVATTVVEVGIDVAGATLMVIENSERLGLAQLHQLRGRVGRGAEESFCLLLYQSPLSQRARQRLQLLRDQQDGFAIAEEDLKLRGPGEILGARQTGGVQFRLADPLRDQALMPLVIAIARGLETQVPSMIEELIRRWHNPHRNYVAV